MPSATHQSARPREPRLDRPPGRTRQAWLEALILFLVALAIRLPHLDNPPQFDELYHLLAARSWLADGELRIADGIYDRAWLYTIALGWWLDLAGDSLAAARIPSVVIGSLWVSALFLWTRAVAGRGPAWIASLLLALAPGAIELSQFIRFYAAQGLLFFLGASGVYALATRRFGLSATAAITLGTIAAFALSMHLQITTAIGLAGIAGWLALEGGNAFLRSRLGAPAKALTIALCLAAAAILFAALWHAGLVESLYRHYRDVALWNADKQDYTGYYFRLFLAQYPTLWSLLPITALIAAAAAPKPATFAICIFGVALVLHSFAGSKWERYIYYAMPFLFLLWGIALAQVVSRGAALFREVVDRAIESVLPFKPAGVWRSLARATVIGVTGLYLVAANPAFTDALNRLRRPPPPGESAVWIAARDTLAPVVEKVAIVLTTDELRSLYYLGRYDVLVNKSRMLETGQTAEFSVDPRTGRPIVTDAASLRSILRCYPSGLFVSTELSWRNPIRMEKGFADLLVQQAERIAVPRPAYDPGGHEMYAFRWQTGRAPDATACAGLPDLVHSTGK